jgi:metal-responsive CopG/Arc/MetJ family transcriptional regulator
MARDRDERVQIMLSSEELAAIDDFRFKNRMPSRAAALREVLRRGLADVRKVSTEGTQSSDFGVLKQQGHKR